MEYFSGSKETLVKTFRGIASFVIIPGLDTAVVLVLLPEEQQHPPRIVVCRAGALAPVQVEVAASLQS